jgi:integrase/recombinase XerC
MGASVDGHLRKGRRKVSPVALPVPSEATKLMRLHRLAQERRGNMPASLERRDISLRAFARWLATSPNGEVEPKGLFDATRQDIELFLDKRRTRDGHKIGARTRRHWLADLHGFYKWALNEELTDIDPTTKIIAPRARRTLPRPIDSDDLVMAVRAAQPQVRAMLSLAAFAGLRISEIAGLDRDDVIEAKGLIRVRHGKGDKERIVPLHPDVLAALHCLPMPRTGALFIRPWGGRHLPYTVGNVINRYLADLGINATAHQLRHWFATEIYSATHDIRITQELLGHSDPATTAGYIAYSHVDAAAAVASLKIGA